MIEEKNPAYGKHGHSQFVRIIASVKVTRQQRNKVYNLSIYQVNKSQRLKKKLLNYQVTKFQSYQHFALPSFQVSKLPSYQANKLPSYQITELTSY